jgi:hypothetical protein
MRRFLVTSPKFAGKVELIYNDGVLVKIDFTAATLTLEGIKWIKNTTPVLYENLETNYGNTSLRVAEVDFDVTFEDFRKPYPRKQNMHLAEKYWGRLTSGEQYQAFISAFEYRKYCERQKLANNFIKLPEGYLRDKLWLNDWKNLDK